MKRDYDQAIKQHYESVADTHGLLSTSTMADLVTRERETEAIVRFVERSLGKLGAEGRTGPATIVDVGCGNGFTLGVLADRWREHRFVGFEHTDALRTLAAFRFQGNSRVQIMAGDIRDAGFACGVAADMLICQRVIINLLDPDDQRAALHNLVGVVRSPSRNEAGGTLLFIEAHTSGLEKLNEARFEFGLPPIPAAQHNLYLSDGFFNIPQLKPLPGDGPLAPNMLSTHYYVARVLHPVISRDEAFKRNSQFVRFLSEGLRPDVGDYSPLKLFMFERIGSD